MLPIGLAFKNYETGVLFLTKLLKKFSEEKGEKGQKQEYLARKQGRDEDLSKYYTDKKCLWEKTYAPNKRSLVEFKNEMLMCKYDAMYDAELKE